MGRARPPAFGPGAGQPFAPNDVAARPLPPYYSDSSVNMHRLPTWADQFAVGKWFINAVTCSYGRSASNHNRAVNLLDQLCSGRVIYGTHMQHRTHQRPLLQFGKRSSVQSISVGRQGAALTNRRASSLFFPHTDGLCGTLIPQQ